MAELSEKASDQEIASAEEMSIQTRTPERLKTCVDCGTTKTPLWRGGPAGPKSLCNACGIRSRKKRRALLGLNKEEKKPKKSMGCSHKSHSNSSGTTSSGESATSNDGWKSESLPLKKRYHSFNEEVSLERPSTHRRKLGEEEQAAFLLMSLSCGSVYA